MGGQPDDVKQKIIAAVETRANEGLKLVAEMKNRKATLTQLRVQAITLDTQVDDTFRKEGPGRKSEVRKNLADALRLIPLMDAEADKVLRDETDFLKKLKPAVDRNLPAFDAPAAPPEQPQPPEEEAPKKKKKSTKSAPPPAAPSGPPVVAPVGPGFEP
jgi:hypothetical protein